MKLKYLSLEINQKYGVLNFRVSLPELKQIFTKRMDPLFRLLDRNLNERIRNIYF